MLNSFRFVPDAEVETPGTITVDERTNTAKLWIEDSEWIPICNDYITTTSTSYPPKSPHRFNCRRCGAVGQIDVCEFCGSVEE